MPGYLGYVPHAGKGKFGGAVEWEQELLHLSVSG